jgi:hypothetical protein
LQAPGRNSKNKCASLPSDSYASAPASKSRFHLNGWRSTGACPLGADVARTDGSRDTPDSSSKTISAFWRFALFQLRPALFHTLVDGFLVALGRSSRRSLPTPL